MSCLYLPLKATRCTCWFMPGRTWHCREARPLLVSWGGPISQIGFLSPSDSFLSAMNSISSSQDRKLVVPLKHFIAYAFQAFVRDFHKQSKCRYLPIACVVCAVRNPGHYSGLGRLLGAGGVVRLQEGFGAKVCESLLHMTELGFVSSQHVRPYYQPNPTRTYDAM